MSNSKKQYGWWFWVYLIRACGLPFHLSPPRVPRDEARKLEQAASANDVVIIFNGGGWGEAELSQSEDFAPILNGIQEKLGALGYRSAVVPYCRVTPGLIGKTAATREQLNSFKYTSETQTGDIRQVSQSFPEKKFLVAGFSVGGGLSGKTLRNLADLPNVYGITVGVPGWYRTHSSEKSLVLNNANQDPVSIGDTRTMAINVFRCPDRWLRSKLSGRSLSVALAMRFPHHEYPWSSPEVGPPILAFLETHFKAKKPLDPASGVSPPDTLQQRSSRL